MTELWFLGRQLEMNDRHAVIVGICETTRTFQSNPVVYTAYSRALDFTPQPADASDLHSGQGQAGTRPGGRREQDPDPDRAQRPGRATNSSG